MTALKTSCYRTVTSDSYPLAIDAALTLRARPRNGLEPKRREDWRSHMTRASKTNGRSGLNSLLTGVSAAALLVSFCAPALAADDDTKAEIRMLKEQLRKLERKLDAQAEAQKETQREVANAKAKGAPGPATRSMFGPVYKGEAP